jgi:hypothetical protein
MLAVSWAFVRANQRTVEPTFQWLQFAAASLISLGHGGNDAQKTMGIIAVLLFSQGHLGSDFYVPFWVVITCQAAMGLGTLVGGWRIVHTVGSKITRMTPVQGFCASTGGAVMLFAATYLDHAHRDGSYHRRRRRTQGFRGALEHRRQHRHCLGHHASGGGANGRAVLSVIRSSQLIVAMPGACTPGKLTRRGVKKRKMCMRC